jgi:hypothetical protein
MMQPISSDFPDPIPRHSAIIPDPQVRAVLYERHERSSRRGMERRTSRNFTWDKTSRINPQPVRCESETPTRKDQTVPRHLLVESRCSPARMGFVFA